MELHRLLQGQWHDLVTATWQGRWSDLATTMEPEYFGGSTLYGEDCKFGIPNVALRGFVIHNIDFAKMGLETLSSCQPCH
jgi:hypothetical protein